MPYPFCCPASGVCHVSSVSTITTRNNQDIKFIFGANVHYVPGDFLDLGHYNLLKL